MKVGEEKNARFLPRARSRSSAKTGGSFIGESSIGLTEKGIMMSAGGDKQ